MPVRMWWSFSVVVPAEPDAWVKRLTGLGLMTGRPGGDPVCTVAGIILFGRRPRWVLRQAGVRWMAFDGDSMDYAAAADTVLDDLLVALWRTRDGSPVLARGSRLDGLMERMRPFVSEKSAELRDGGRRERRWHYPAAVLREALVNALAHRDWIRMEDVEVVHYRNRLEVKSAGALQNSITMEKMLAGQRSPRSALILDVFRDYGMGMWIPGACRCSDRTTMTRIWNGCALRTSRKASRNSPMRSVGARDRRSRSVRVKKLVPSGT